MTTTTTLTEDISLLAATDAPTRDEHRRPGWRRMAGLAAATVLLTAVYLLLIVQGNPAHADGFNPFTDVKPDPGLLGSALNTAWKRLLGAIWAGALIILGAQMVMAAVKRSQASRQGHSADLADSTEAIRDAGIRFGIASGISIIVGAIMFAVNA